MKRYGSLRWVLLIMGITVILGLSAMNAYLLHSLHKNTIKLDRKPKKLQISEFAERVQYRFYKPFWRLETSNIKQLITKFEKNGKLTKRLKDILHKVDEDSMYDNIYYISASNNPCIHQAPIQKFNLKTNNFQEISAYPPVICEGLHTTRTRMKTLEKNFKHSDKIIFNSYKSIGVALINLNNQSAMGYLIIPINQHYLMTSFLPRSLREHLGDQKNSNMSIWIRDWKNNTIIASNDSSLVYDKNKIQFKKSFPKAFDSWNIEVAFSNTPVVEASKSSLIRNLVILGLAVLLLLGALVFIFISAQKERALAQRQADFLANVTHELKTPISLMQAAGENLADGRVQSRNRLKEYGNHIYHEAVRLRKMIEKLLDVAKSGSNHLKINKKPLDLQKMIETYLYSNKNLIVEKGFTLEKDMRKTLPPILCDAKCFETIFNNLIENAVKYSNDDKYICIRTKQQNDKVLLAITDHGIGMTNQQQKHIFDKFYRAEESLTAKTKGYGLGLAIVKDLVKLNNASIQVKSKVDKGATFILRFEIADESAGQSEATTAERDLQTESLT